MTEFRRPSFEEIIADRMRRSDEYANRADEAVKDSSVRGFDSEHVINTLPGKTRRLLELYRIDNGEYYIEARWILAYNTFKRIFDGLEIYDSHKRHTNYLLLIWESANPSPREDALTKGFMSAFNAVRIAAYLPKAFDVAFVKGENKDIGFDEIIG